LLALRTSAYKNLRELPIRKPVPKPRVYKDIAVTKTAEELVPPGDALAPSTPWALENLPPFPAIATQLLQVVSG